MANGRQLTDDELEEVSANALNQLADSLREYDTAKRMHAAKRPNQKRSVERFNTAKESLRLSLHVYHGLRDQIEQRYQSGNPV